jgi:hypothetical protein
VPLHKTIGNIHRTKGIAGIATFINLGMLHEVVLPYAGMIPLFSRENREISHD